MRLDRLFAILLIVLCLVASLGNWLGGQAPKSPKTATRSADVALAKRSTDVALLDIYGAISDSASSGTFGGSAGANSNALIRNIRQAKRDQVKAILLRINSPGGTAAASQAVYDELMRLRQSEDQDIKIVASLGDVAASGGYFIASAADHIVANPATITGSIGVIIRTQNLSALFDKVGVTNTSIKSGQYKDILSPYREIQPDEQALLQEIVDESYSQFVDAIVKGRNMDEATVKPLADGRIYTGTQAQANGLVDSLGNYADALDQVAELAEISGEPTVRNYGRRSPLDILRRLLSSSLEDWIPGYQITRLTHGHKIPLMLME